MPAYNENEFISDDGLQFVPVAFAENEDQAQIYRQALDDHGIDALVGFDELEKHVDPETVTGEMSTGIPIFVTEEYLDEASEVIAQRADIDDFDPLDLDYDSDDESEDDDMLSSKLDSTGSWVDEDESPAPARNTPPANNDFLTDEIIFRDFGMDHSPADSGASDDDDLLGATLRESLAGGLDDFDDDLRKDTSSDSADSEEKIDRDKPAGSSRARGTLSDILGGLDLGDLGDLGDLDDFDDEIDYEE